MGSAKSANLHICKEFDRHNTRAELDELDGLGRWMAGLNQDPRLDVGALHVFRARWLIWKMGEVEILLDLCCSICYAGQTI